MILAFSILIRLWRIENNSKVSGESFQFMLMMNIPGSFWKLFLKHVMRKGMMLCWTGRFRDQARAIAV
jgi:hypothetical protein